MWLVAGSQRELSRKVRLHHRSCRHRLQDGVIYFQLVRLSLVTDNSRFWRISHEEFIFTLLAGLLGSCKVLICD